MGWSRIRVYSRLGALALAALVLAGVLALRVPRREDHFSSLTIISYIVTAPAPQHDRPPPRKPPPDVVLHAVAASFLGPPSSDAPPRLWTYSTAGEIVFDHAEHFRRCVAARAEHHNEADCPEPHDTHPLVLRPG
ncbi:MAG: hypothetical protein WAU68_10550 [Vitreimonas sp.]